MQKLQSKVELTSAYSGAIQQLHSKKIALPTALYNRTDISKGDLGSVNAFTDYKMDNSAEGDLEILSLTLTHRDRPALPECMPIMTAAQTQVSSIK